MLVFVVGSFAPHLLFAYEDVKPEAELEGILMQQSWSDELREEVTLSPRSGVEVLALDFIEPSQWNIIDISEGEPWEGSFQGLNAIVDIFDSNHEFEVDHNVAQGFDQSVKQMRNSLRKSLPIEGRPGDQARSIMSRFRARDNVDSEDLYNNALQFMKSGEVMDAYLLYYFAARKGHINSSVALAKMYDPNYFSKENSSVDQFDAALAFSWYKKAADKGNRVALAGLETLRHWVETSLPDHTPEKQRLLLLWKKTLIPGSTL